MGGRFRKITGREVGGDSGGEYMSGWWGLKRKWNREGGIEKVWGEDGIEVGFRQIKGGIG